MPFQPDLRGFVDSARRFTVGRPFRHGAAWAVRLILLLALLSLVRPPGILVTLGEPQAVVTRNELAGVHTRFTDEVEQWKIQRGLSMVREMGAPWIVEFFPWAYSEPRQGQYDWTNAERIVRHAERQGLRVIARLGFVPEWARPIRTHNPPPSPI